MSKKEAIQTAKARRAAGESVAVFKSTFWNSRGGYLQAEYSVRTVNR